MEDEEYEKYEEYEKEYKPPKFTDRELLEIFPEAKEIIPIKIKETKEEINKKKTDIRVQLKRLYSLKVDKFSEWFGEKLIEIFVVPELTVLEKRLFRLNCFLPLLNPKTKKHDVQFSGKNRDCKKLSNCRNSSG